MQSSWRFNCRIIVDVVLLLVEERNFKFVKQKAIVPRLRHNYFMPRRGYPRNFARIYHVVH